MFPLNGGNELVIQFSSCPHKQQHNISEDLILDGYCSPDSCDFAKTVGNSQQKKLSHGDQKNFGQHFPRENRKKKMIHREIERQRRRQMATLHASLRSLLPLKFIKGKRSISDHMNEAVNYIKQLKKNIKELSAKRDEIKKLSYSCTENHDSNNTSGTGSFVIHENDGAIGIEIANGCREENFPLSKLLELLLEEGLEVVNCLSSEVNGRLIHSVQCEVNNSKSLDLPELRRKVSMLFHFL
ncbi:hypothetical protein L6164_008278 [Bauhinia variegata]|uniref:Uncharacterized protein n=1 Tax=Bauhinia variegata TaxID=167791 RepID=A0ACB9PGA3_BAUVA|nr:hypothetical protein L6164_008278 [Bauhinia variegata]